MLKAEQGAVATAGVRGLLVSQAEEAAVKAPGVEVASAERVSAAGAKD